MVSSIYPQSYRRILLACSSSSSNAGGGTAETASARTGNASGRTTVTQALQKSVAALQQANVPDPIPSAVQLLALALDLPWDTGYRDLMRLWESAVATAITTTTPQPFLELTETQVATLEQLMQRRLQHEPLQYICGQWDFLDYTLEVRKPLLCPRPETEELVQMVLRDVLGSKTPQSPPSHTSTSLNESPHTKNRMRILDIGCGTGCIGIALADQVPGSMVTAIDIEPIAIVTAQRNAQRILGDDWSQRYEAHLVACQDYHLIRPNDSNKPQQQQSLKYHLVVSNPPYIPAADMLHLDRTVVEYESSTALWGGGDDGMDVIRTIVQRLPEWCHPGSYCWLEVDPTHPPIIREWLSKKEQQSQDVLNPKPLPSSGPSIGVKFVGSRHDMFGRERFVLLRTVDG